MPWVAATALQSSLSRRCSGWQSKQIAQPCSDWDCAAAGQGEDSGGGGGGGGSLDAVCIALKRQGLLPEWVHLLLKNPHLFDRVFTRMFGKVRHSGLKRYQVDDRTAGTMPNSSQCTSCKPYVLGCCCKQDSVVGVSLCNQQTEGIRLAVLAVCIQSPGASGGAELAASRALAAFCSRHTSAPGRGPSTQQQQQGAGGLRPQVAGRTGPGAAPSGSGASGAALSSRYRSDFQELYRLGKGGFGVVVAAVNRWDLCWGGLGMGMGMVCVYAQPSEDFIQRALSRRWMHALAICRYTVA